MSIAGKLKAAINLTRPQQWFKSLYLIVGAAPAMFLTAPNLTITPFLLLGGILNLILMQGVIYTINDIGDLPADRNHPTKSKRPIASGRISKNAALLLAILFLATALYIGYVLSPMIALVDLLLLANGLAYSMKPLRFKDRRYIDMASAALNFPFRVMVGWILFEPYNEAKLAFDIGVTSTQIVSNSIQLLLFSAPPGIIEISTKFSTVTLSFVSMLAMTFFIAMFMLSLKRCSELMMNMKPESRRAVLDRYSKRELSVIARFSALFALLFFALLAVSIKPLILLSAPLAIYGMWLYYKMALSSSAASEPEKVFARHSKIIGIFILFLLVCGLLLFL